MTVKKYSESDLVVQSQEQLFYLAKYFLIINDDFNKDFDDLPFWVQLNGTPDMLVRKVNKRVAMDTDVSTEELLACPKKFYNQRVNPETTRKILPYLIKFYQNPDYDEILVFDQEIKLFNDKVYTNFFSFSKIISTEYFFAITFPCNKIERFIKNKSFSSNPIFQKYYKSYNTLTNREKEILGKISNGKTTKNISDELFISDLTVKTHR